MRKKIYDIIEPGTHTSRLSDFYDWFMIAVIGLSLVPLFFRESTLPLEILDKVTVSIFIADYFLRIWTADYKYGEHRAKSFLRYPLSPMAIIDLLSILPSLTVLNGGFKLLRSVRLVRAMRVIRIFKTARYSKSFRITRNVFRENRGALLTVCFIAVGYILITSLIIFNVEPESFPTFFDALYWATISLTTVGYGDIYAVSTVGRVITMFSSFFGIAVVALPSGIITAGYMAELEKERKNTSARRGPADRRGKGQEEIPAGPGGGAPDGPAEN